MRALSLSQASRCETAKNSTCRCRCHGDLHGTKRSSVENMGDLQEKLERAFFETLPEDDPHHVRSVEEKKRRAKIRRAAAKAPRQQTLWPLLAEDAQ